MRALPLLLVLAATSAFARAPVVLRVTDGNNAGPPGKNTGPGAEQPTLVQSVVNGTEYVTVVWMSSQVPQDDAPYQCKCATVQMDPVQGPTMVVQPTQLTHNRGNRPCNHPHMDINPATNQILLSYGTNDPNQADVQPYVQGLDTMCNITTDRVHIGRDAGNDGAPWVQHVDTATGLFQVGYLENNQRSRAVGVTFDPATNTITKLYNKVIVDPANIGRPSVARVSDTRTMFCSSNGDNRPPEIGGACAMVDATTGDKLWLDVIARSQPNATPPTFMNQPVVVQGDNGRFFVSAEQTHGPTGGNTRGATTTFVYTLNPDDTGPNVLANPVSGVGANQVHATLCNGHFGPDASTLNIAVFDASITGSGFAAAHLLHFDPIANNLVNIDGTTAGGTKGEPVLGSYNGDSGYLANIYGQNPNDQGRDFMRCMGDLPNPGFQAEAGFLSTVQSFFVFPFAGRVPGEDKNSLFLSFLPAVEPPGPPVVDHNLNVFVAGDGIGKVFSSPLGIDGCDNVHGCTAIYEEGVSVVLTAVPSAGGSTFSGWTGDCTGTGGCVIPMNGDKTVTATFLGPVDPGHPVGMIVTVAGKGTGTVTTDPAGIKCSSGTCTNNFDQNALVTVSGKADAGSIFKGFTGACTGTAPCKLTMSAAQLLTAEFDIDPNAKIPGPGGVTKKPGSIATAGCGCTSTGESGFAAAWILVGVGALWRSRRRAKLAAAAAVAGAISIACAPAAPDPAIDVFSADQLQVAQGTPVQLSYFVRNASGVTISQIGGADLLSFSDQLNGTVYTPPLTAATTFILIAHGAAQVGAAPVAVTKSVSIGIGAGTGNPGDPNNPPPASQHAAVALFSAKDASITTGGSTIVSWQTTGATTGVILANDAILSTIDTSQLATGTLNVTPTEQTVYTISVIGADAQQVTATTAVDVTQPGVGALTAHDEFESNVNPILTTECSSCHMSPGSDGAPAFLGAGPDFYTPVTSDSRFLTTPENSLLLLKGAHAGPAFTPPETQEIQSWLLKEIQERGSSTTTPPAGTNQPADLSQALTRFGACMQRTVWDQTYGASNDTQAAHQGTTQGQCDACHTTGTGGAFLSQVSGDTFQMNTTSPYILKLVLGTVNSDGTFKDLVAAQRWQKKGDEAGSSDPQHPSFQMAQTRVDAINSFVDQTLTRFHDTTDPCTSP